MTNRILLAGDSGGLGRLIGHHLLSQNYQIRGFSRRPHSEFDDAPHWKHYQIDAAQEEQVETLVNLLKKENWRPEIILNCVGVSFNKPIMMASYGELLRVFEGNLAPAFTIQKIFSKYLFADRKAKIVHMSSIHATMSSTGASAYSMSKIAVETLIKSFVLEAGNFGPRTICIRLPYIENIGMAETFKESGSDDGAKSINTISSDSFLEFLSNICQNENAYDTEDTIVTISP